MLPREKTILRSIVFITTVSSRQDKTLYIATLISSLNISSRWSHNLPNSSKKNQLSPAGTNHYSLFTVHTMLHKSLILLEYKHQQNRQFWATGSTVKWKGKSARSNYCYIVVNYCSVWFVYMATQTHVHQPPPPHFFSNLQINDYLKITG